MSVKAFHSIISSSGYPEETPLGTIYSSSLFTNLNDFTANGITASVNGSNQIELSNGSATTFNATLDYNRYSRLENWSITMQFVIQSGSEGGGVGMRSVSTWQKWNVAGSWASGFISIQTGRVASMSTQASTVTACAGSVGDTMELTLSKSAQTVTVSCRNITTGGSLVSASYSFVTTIIAPALTPNTGRFAVSSYSTSTMVVKSISISSTVVKNAKICIIVDSIGEAYCAESYALAYPRLVNNSYTSTNISAGQNDGLPEALLLIDELLELNARVYIMAIGINDIGNGVPSATYLARYASVVSQLQAAGKRVIHTYYYSTTTDVSPLTNYIAANYSSDYIIDTTSGLVSGDLIADGIHLGPSGHSKVATNIIDSNALSIAASLYGWGSSDNLSSGLVSYWKFDSDANDSIGSNNGTLAGSPPSVAGKISNCYSFNGSTRYIVVNDASNLTFGNGTVDSPFSFSMWINPTSYSALTWILNKRTNVSTVCEYNLVLETTGKVSLILFSQGAATAFVYRKGNIALSTGQWAHVVVTYDGTGYSGIKIYVNRVLSTSDTNSSVGSYVAMSNTAADLRIATAYTLGSSGFNGLIDELGLWSRVLTPTEINSLYNSGTGISYPF